MSPPGHPDTAGAYRRLLGYLRPWMAPFLGGLGLMVVSALFDTFSLVLLIPFLQSLFDAGGILGPGAGNLVERFLEWSVGPWVRAGTPLASLRNICILVLGAILGKNVALYGANYLSIVVQERVEQSMREDVYARLQRLPLSFFGAEKTGQLLARVLTDTRTAKTAVGQPLTELVRKAVTAVAYVATLVLLSWRLTLLALVLAPALALSLRPVLRKLRRRFRRAYDHQGDLLSVLQETVSGIRLVKAFGAEERERRRFEESSGSYTGRLIHARGLSELTSPLSEVLSSLVALGLIWIGANLVLGEAGLGPETFLAFITLAVRLISPIKALARFPAQAEQAAAAAERFFEVLDAAPEPPDPPDALEARPPREGIGFEDVWFAYEPGRPVLRGIDLEVQRGEVLALVGPSGAGKSTLVDLLPRFIDPTGGRVTLDGTDLRRFSRASLRGLFGIVSQETVLFHDTVRENIAYGAGEWTDAEVEEAARAANAHGFIAELPDGYATPLGDRGVRLSGGQRQRIGIARALLRDPPILILDEATSSLDTESEQLIQRALARLLEGRTVFVIAHRLSTVRDADRLVVLDQGRIVEVGTHAELLARGGLYRRLYEMQFSALDPPAQAAGSGSGSAS